MKIFNLLALVALGIIYFYQYTLSYFFGGQCRFYPSCSHYAIESYQHHNFFAASILVFKRLSRCHPFSKSSGYDPVPFTYEGKKT